MVSAIGILGTLIGLAWSTIALQLGALCNHSGPSVGGRAIPGVFLAIAIFLSMSLHVLTVCSAQAYSQAVRSSHAFQRRRPGA